ncbi:hypothetical protein [Cereibacter sediminicola]|uniref:hypothetical protein n=1 Tax=Cereibacter sediminicola TaxID=2584941 RepID=UPI0011A442AB|nr:hypothetical protein [Cereibacter sediminicola]
MAYARNETRAGQGRNSTLMLTSAVILGAFGALAVRHLMNSRQPSGYPDVRPAGPDAMREPPSDWDEVDEQLDESFPASDPPSNY